MEGRTGEWAGGEDTAEYASPKPLYAAPSNVTHPKGDYDTTRDRAVDSPIAQPGQNLTSSLQVETRTRAAKTRVADELGVERVGTGPGAV